MRSLYLLALFAATGCVDVVDARWQLDHDHIVAVRATPPRVAEPGQVVVLDALVAHDGALTAVEHPSAAVGSDEHAELRDLVAFVDGKWTVTAPSHEALLRVRSRMGREADAPVPYDVALAFERPGAEPMLAKKTVWFGASAQNPVIADIVVDGQPAPEEIVVPRERDVYVSVSVGADARVNWLTSCGTLFQDDVATAFVRVLPEDRGEGELAVVVRAPDGGVAWRVWPMRAE